jgi:ribosomal protein L32
LPHLASSARILPTMSVRMRINRAATKRRRSHEKLSKPAITRDSGGLALRHRVSPVTGTYKGKQIIDVNKKATKRSQRVEQKSEQKEAASATASTEEKAPKKLFKKESKADSKIKIADVPKQKMDHKTADKG